MKLILTIILFIIVSSENICASNDWIPYQNTNNHVQLFQPVIEISSTPTITYSNIYIFKPQIITYGWVPYNVMKTTIIEKQGIFFQHKYIIQQPCIEWIYQPIYK
jgi:hypothetical protein